MNDEKPSKTAYKVALNILTLGVKPDMTEILPAGIVDTTEKLLIASGAAKPNSVRWSRSSWMVSVYEAFDWMMPGQFETFAHRKAFCENQVREGIAGGTSQILVLGAGYDTMGWRLAPEFPSVNFFEIDHPATASLKAKGIQGMGLRPNLHLISEDLGNRDLIDVLTEDENWDISASTTFIAEGLLQYLSPLAVQDLFIQCASVVGNGRIAFTYIPAQEDGRPDAGPWSGLVLWLLKAFGEPWLWSIRTEELDQFLKKSGWTNNPELIKGYTGKHGIELYAAATKSE